MKEQLGIL